MCIRAYSLPPTLPPRTHLERQAGGGLSKGMGEKQIEVDKRLLRKRMGVLRKDLDDVSTASGNPQLEQRAL